jgi:hypothetical protein
MTFHCWTFYKGLFMAALLITRPYSSPDILASLILGNGNASGDEQGFAMNWAGMNCLAMKCPSACLMHYKTD